MRLKTVEGEVVEILLDVRTLSHPEPFEMAMDALRNWKSGQYIKMVHRREPLLLYPELGKMGFLYKTLRISDSLFEIYIWKEGEPSPVAAGVPA